MNQPQPAEPAGDELIKLKNEIINELSNAYYESYRYDRPNDTYEQLGAFCRDLASNDVEELCKQQIRAVLLRLMEVERETSWDDTEFIPLSAVTKELEGL